MQRRSLLLVGLVLLAACRSSPPEREVGAPEPNRDPHGNPDVSAYIQTLEGDDRLGHLQIETVVARLALPPDAEVADLGCGPGAFAIAFARVVTDGLVYACDIEPRQLDAVRAKVAATGVRNVVPVLASPNDPHLPPSRLDLVFLGDTYHHLRDRVDYLRRLQRCLRPGGRLAILEYKSGDLPVGPPAGHKLPSGVMERELIEAGWRRVEVFDTHAYHDFEVWRVVQPWEPR